MSSTPAFPGGIRSKILLLAIVPVLSISILLTWFYITQRQFQLEQNLERFGQSTTEYLAIASELAMFADDLDSLQQIGKGPLSNRSMHGVAFYHADGSEILTLEHSGEHSHQHSRKHSERLGAPPLLDEPLWRNNQHREDAHWYFRSAIKLEAEPVTDYGETGGEAGPLLGWVVVTLSQQELHQSQRDNIVLATVISIVATLLVTLAAWLLSHRIYQPVRDLTRIVETMDSGDLTVQATVAGEREVQILARVINRLASRLSQTNVRLKQEVDEATGDLRKALEDLEQALGAKDQFLARMSHELRTPLTTILGFTRRLEHTPLSGEQSEYSHAIQHASVLLLSVINDILDFSRLQYSGITLDEGKFDLEQELEDIAAMHAYSAYEKSIELVMFIDSDVPREVLGDAVRLKQVLNNLLANSVKFTDSGEIIVRVSRHDADDELAPREASYTESALKLEISVQDSGIGISAEDMEKLFKPFSQADSSISRRFGGSGLGLVICQQLVELMGGEVTVSSTPGDGTEICFTVLLHRSGDGHNEVPIPSRTDPVAIVDSNVWSRRALRSQLTHWTRRVYAVADSTELIKLISSDQQPFSTVLISLAPGAMERQPLLQVLTEIRIHYQGPIVLLACMSNVPDAVLQRVLSEFAPIWCLPKPVRRTKLLAWLEAIGESEIEKPVGKRPPEALDSLSAGCLQGLRILVAEDNHFNQKLVRTLLEAEGASTVLADSGAQAIERFQQSNCSLVLMDAHMPTVDGIEACRQIMAQAAHSGRSIAVIGLTADTVDGERDRFLQAGAREVLYKPVDEDALFAALCRYAGRTYSGRKETSILSAVSSKSELQRELRKQTVKLRRALETGQLIDSRDTLHQLSGLAGMHGMEEFRQKVLALRESLGQKQDGEVQEQLDALDVLVSRTIDRDDH